MVDRDRDQVGRHHPSSWPTEAVWSTLLVLALGAGVLIWSYTAPKPIAAGYRGTESALPSTAR
jgi:hypothetical protein